MNNLFKKSEDGGHDLVSVRITNAFLDVGGPPDYQEMPKGGKLDAKQSATAQKLALV